MTLVMSIDQRFELDLVPAELSGVMPKEGPRLKLHVQVLAVTVTMLPMGIGLAGCLAVQLLAPLCLMCHALTVLVEVSQISDSVSTDSPAAADSSFSAIT